MTQYLLRAFREDPRRWHQQIQYQKNYPNTILILLTLPDNEVIKRSASSCPHKDRISWLQHFQTNIKSIGVLIFNSGVVHYKLHKQQNELVVELGVSPACKMLGNEEVDCNWSGVQMHTLRDSRSFRNHVLYDSKNFCRGHFWQVTPRRHTPCHLFSACKNHITK